MYLKKILPLLVLVLALPAAVWAQVTTSAVSGIAKTAAGQPLVGATVIATHEPTGTQYKTQTRSGGTFALANMNPGGPYRIVISFLNYADDVKTDIYLDLGETQKITGSLVEKSAALADVTVNGIRKTTGLASGRGGTETTIGREQMAGLPSVGRNLNDFLRAVPQARATGANGDGISIAGQNNRYNGFYIDGALNNDAFGLAGSGTNGGQTNTPPLSIDAIDQFQVVVSPYDASLGNFTGGGINAITKSGTNTTQGSVYYFYRNQDLAGKTPTGDKAAATRFADFTAKTYGFRVGGALKKNKFFYFISAESQRDTRPQPFDVTNGYLGLTRSPADIQRLVDTLRARGGYNPGSYLDNPEIVNADRIAVKLDWNISDRHKLSVSHRFTQAERFNTTGSSANAINFNNNGFVFPNRTNSTSLELKSVVGRSASNRLLLTYSDVTDDRGPIGQAYPRITIFDAGGTSTAQSINIGPDVSSTINFLSQRQFSLINNFKFTYKKHNINMGVEYEFGQYKNSFIQRVWGEYQYDSIGQFYRNLRPRQFRRAFSLVDNENTDATNAAARFMVARAAGFFNDEIRVNDNFTLNVGVRGDYNKWLSNPAEDPYANNVAIPAFATAFDMQGARSGQRPNIPLSISPRLGFTYKIPEENITVRGGVGFFTGRIPLVWPAGIYNNNGLFIGGFTANSSNNVAAWNQIRFRQDPFNQWGANELGIGLNKGGLNLISETFRNPRVLRASVAVDKKFNDGWSTTIEGLITKGINEIYYTNLSAGAPVGRSTGDDSRVLYSGARIAIPGGNPYDNAILLSNNQGQKGVTYNLTWTLDKKTRTGFNFNVNYTYGNAFAVNDGTSSVNLSQWQFMETVNGRNNITRSQSDFSMGHRIFAYMSKRFTYANKTMATTISLVYTGQSGSPMSYVYGGAFVRDDISVGGAGGNDLIFVPTAAQMGNMSIAQQVAGGATAAAAIPRATQLAALDQYIASNRYLNGRRGNFAERNGSRLPFTHIIDLKVAQDFNVRVGKNRYQFQLTYEVFNVGNMLNRDWGRTWFLGNDQFGAIAFRGFTTPGNTNPTNAQISTNGPTATQTQPVYQFNTSFVGRDPWNVSISSVPAVAARWVSQVGVRFNFN